MYQEYDDLVEAVQDLATKFMDPIIEDSQKTNQVLGSTKKRSSEWATFFKYMSTHPSLVNGCDYTETDVDVYIGLVMRFLSERVFQTTLCGTMALAVDTLNFVARTMESEVEPQRGKNNCRLFCTSQCHQLLTPDR